MKRTYPFLLIIIVNALLVCCGNTNTKLKVIEEYNLKVPEPSGLALSFDKKYLWTVSDQNSTVYLITLKGKIEKSFKVNVDDLEGIAVINDTSIAVVAERSREIILLNNNGKELSRKKILYEKPSNRGLEGIAINNNTGHVFVIKEKKPKDLIELDKNLKEVKRTQMDFAKDFSGLDFVEESNDLWIISDEDKLAAKCYPNGRVKEKYHVDITQIEGIAVNQKINKIYLVSDKEEKLYVLEMK